MKSKKWKFCFIYIFVLNLLDALATHYSVGQGFAEELNPLMNYLLELHPATFYLCKITLVILGLSLLYRLGESRGTKIALAVCAAIYTAIMFVHISMFV